MTREECAAKADAARSKLTELKALWPEDPDACEEHSLLEHCGLLLDEIGDLVHALDVGLNY